MRRQSATGSALKEPTDRDASHVQADRNAADVMKKAEPYHDASSRLWNRPVSLGMADATMV